MPAAKLSLDFQGLVTATGKIQAPPGSLTEALNFNFTAPGIAEKRRGLARSAFPNDSGAIWKMYSSPLLGDALLISQGAGGASPLYSRATSIAYGEPATGFAALPTSDNVAGTNVDCAFDKRSRITAHGRTHYGTSQRACWRVVNAGATPARIEWAGMPRPFGFYAEAGFTLVPVTGGCLPHANAFAYRVVWMIPGNDADPNPTLLSPPSGRFVVMNTSGTPGHSGGTDANVTLRILIPERSDTGSTAITTDWKYQVYRSRAFAIATGQPDDELQLVYEASPTAGEITTGWLDFTDRSPQGVGGAYLYTNTTLGGDVSTGAIVPGTAGLSGILASNDRPPIARDIATFSDCVVYGNIQTPQRLLVSLLAVGTTGDVVKATDVLTFTQGASSFTMTATTTANAPNTGNFQVFTAYSSIALNIRQTAINLCAAINSRSTNDWLTATYVGNDTLPGTVGQILLEARRTDGAQFSVDVTTGSRLPYVPQIQAGGLASEAEAKPNYLAVSKPGLADSVPPANYIQVGPPDADILALVPLRDALFVFTDRGIYWMRGDTPAQFVVEPFDLTFRLIGTELATVCEDALYAWGREGIARITNGGLDYIDLPIRNLTLQAIRGLDATVGLVSLAARGFATAYPTERRVLFFFRGGAEEVTRTPSFVADEYGCRYAFVYNIATGGWSQYDYGNATGKLSGVVRVTDELLYCGEWNAGNPSRFYSEKDAQAAADFSDTSRTGSAVAINSVLEWTVVAPDPVAINHWREVQAYFNKSDLVVAYGLPTSISVTITSEFGGVQLSTLVPLSEQSRVLFEPAVGMSSRCVVRLRHNVSGEYCCIGGWGLIYSPVSNFNTR